MPKGGAIPTTERRSWLERYEQGASIDTIARESRRTQRTVTAQLDRARQERQHDLVQVDLIRDAYRQHYGDLLEVAEELAERCDSPDSRGILPELVVETDTRMLYEALRSHVPGSRLWSGVKTWEESSRSLAAESTQAAADSGRRSTGSSGTARPAAGIVTSRGITARHCLLERMKLLQRDL